MADQGPTEPINSLSLWRRLFDSPYDPGLWDVLLQRYKDLIHAWARRWARDEADVEDIFSETMKRLIQIFSDGTARFEPACGSYKPYVQAIVRHLCFDLFRRRGREVTLGDDAEFADRARGAADDLADLIIEQEEREMQARVLPQYIDLYRDALRLRKNQPQFDPRSATIFFEYYHQGLSSAEINERHGFPSTYPDRSGRYARRERDRLVFLMGLPACSEADKQSALAIVEQLAKRYGDVSSG